MEGKERVSSVRTGCGATYVEGEREVSSVGAGCGATYVEGGKKRPGANGFKDT